MYNLVFQYKPIVTGVSKEYLHHMILYECILDNKDMYLDHWASHEGAQCHTPNMPLSFSFCTNLIASYDIGSEGLFFW